MDKVIFPLGPRAQGPAVANLQDALQLCLKRGDILAEDEEARRELSVALKREHALQTYGDVTTELISMFQTGHDLHPSGEVDERTAALINELLQKEATALGERLVVKGRVALADGKPFIAGHVRAYDCGLRGSRTPLGDATTDQQGHYVITYSPRELGKTHANLLVEAVNADNIVISVPHDIIYQAGRDETIDLTIDCTKYHARPEYARVLEAICPALGEMPLTELTETGDVRVLAANAGVDTQQVECAIAAARFSAKTGLPAELGYVLARQNLSTIPRLLMRHDQRAVRAALEAGIADNLISETGVDELLDKLHARAIEEELEVIPDSGSDRTLGTLFSLSPIIGEDGEKAAVQRRVFVEEYFKHQGMTDEFWKDLRARPEFADKSIVEEYEFIAELDSLVRSIPIARAIHTELRRNRDVLQRYDLAQLDIPVLRRLVKAAGIPTDQVEARAAEIFRSIEARYATRVVFHQLEREDEELPGAREVRAFLAERLAIEPDFDLGRQHVRAYLDAAANTPAGEQLLGWQRAYRMAPVMDRYAAIRALRKMSHADSATAVVHMGRDAFTRQFVAVSNDKKRAGELALQVWTKACHVHAMALNLYSEFGAIFNRVRPYAIPHLEMSDKIGNPVSLSDLFGSLDFCECQHCESLYSPAAYLADLLNFLQQGPTNKDGTSPYDVLCTRRPDLATLELSCENTDTMVPHIDLVNEILEDRVEVLPRNLSIKLPGELPRWAHPAQPMIAGYGIALHEIPLASVGNQLTPQLIVKSLENVLPQADPPTHLTTAGTNGFLLADKKHIVIPDFSSIKSKLLVYPLPTRQTTWDTPTLRAQPEHLNLRLDVYDRLAHEVFPWNLPFELGFEEARLYLRHLRFKRYLWLERLSRSEAEVTRDVLGLIPLEWDLITGTAGRSQQSLWGLPQDRALDDLHNDLRSARLLMRQAGFDFRTTQAFKEFRRLLRGTRYINRDGSLDIPVLDDKCDLACLQVEHSASLPWGETLDRIRRFVRLQRKLGWSSRELDKAITAFGIGINDTFLGHVACIKRLHTDLRVPLVEMFGWWGLLDTAEDLTEEVEGKKERSLYEKLFLNRSVVFPADRRFELNPKRTEVEREAKFTVPLRAGETVNVQFVRESFRNEYAKTHMVAQPHVTVKNGWGRWEWLIEFRLTDEKWVAWYEGSPHGSGLLCFAPATKITALTPQVTGALEIDAADLDRILGASEVANVLNLANLSHLYRIVSLARALKLKVKDFLSAKALIRTDPFDSPSSTLKFIEKLRKIEGSQFSISELDYLLRHRFEATDAISLTEAEIRHILADIRSGLLKIEAETADQADPDGELTKARLALVIEPDRADVVVEVLGGCSTGVPEEFECPKAASPWLTHNKATKTLSFTGVMTEQEKTTLLVMADGADYEKAVEALHEKPRSVVEEELRHLPGLKKDICAFLDQGGVLTLPREAVFSGVLRILNQHLRRMRGQNLIEQQLSSSLGLETDTAKLLIETLVKGRQDPTNGVIEDFLALSRVGMCTDKDNAKALRALLQAAQTDTYQLVVQPDVGAKLKLDGIRLSPATSIALKAGELYEIRLHYTKAVPVKYQLLWQTPSLSIRPIPVDRLIPADVFDSCRTSFILLHKLALLIKKLNLKEYELRYLAEHGKDFGGFDLNCLPTTETSLDLFGQWEALYDAFSFRDRYPQRDIRLIDVFRAAAEFGATEAQQKLAGLTGWDADQLTIIAGPDGLNLSTDDLKCGHKFNDLHEAFKTLRQLGISAKQFCALLQSDLSVPALRQIVKAKYRQEEWLKVAKPLQDELREKRRDALVSFLVHADNDLESADDLFEKYLIDVEMSSCMMTSRIKQAISSVQLFIQRCLMNLESKVALDANAAQQWAQQWQWRKYYRVWEANRKVFLYPENWIEPELRDDKSPFFEDLENELLQNEINDENVEKAFLRYLQKLDEASHLEIAAFCTQKGDWYEPTENTAQGYVIHVFGRTRSLPHRYYYRRWLACASRWTPWERVDLDIEGDHLIPVFWNRRLYLFWPKFKEVSPDESECPWPSIEAGKPAQKWHKVQLVWSEYSGQRWSPTKANSELSCQILGGLKYTDRYWFAIDPRTDPRTAPGTLRIGALTYTDDTNTKTGSSTHRWNLVDCQLSRSWDLQWLRGADIRIQYPGYIDHTKGRKLYRKNGTEGLMLQRWDIVDLKGESIEPAFVKQTEIRLLNATPSQFALTYESRFPSEYYEDYSEYGPCYFFWRQPFFYEDAERTFLVQFEESNGSHWIDNRTTWTLFCHPYAQTFIERINGSGVDGLLGPRASSDARQAGSRVLDVYQPDRNNVKEPFPIEDIDFRPDGAYSLYNWELFFHIPLLIADRLSKNQRFEEAMRWFHYIFDPTETSGGEAPARFWKVRPFYEAYQATDQQLAGPPKRIQELMKSLHEGNPSLQKQIIAWENNPFKPHLVARLRIEAYMKAVVMKYIDNLIAWGDQLFRRDTIESINEATQLYVLAAKLLGLRPQEITLRKRSKRTFHDLKAEFESDPLSNALIRVQDVLPEFNEDLTLPDAPLQTLEFLYFCIPNNDKLLGYWDTVADRLFKIRHCMNIEGVVRQLPLFEPPIDPALLVRATAAGIDIGSVMNDLYAPLPHYRFTVMAQKAAELCADVKSLGAALLAVLEKKDAEELALMRSEHEIKLLEAVKEVRKRQIEEAKGALEGTQRAKDVTSIKHAYYKNIQFMNANEKAHLDLMQIAAVIQAVGQMLEMSASAAHPIPDAYAGGAGMCSPLVFTHAGGGAKTAAALQAFGRSMGIYAALLSTAASTSATLGSYQRRADDWKLQEQIAGKELEQIDKQILAGEIRLAIAENELSNHELQIENAKEVEAWMRTTKFTNAQLYGWMVGQLSTLYFQAYQLAYDLAKRAEKAFRHELGLTDSDSSFIKFGYWDSLKKGLLAGERLFQDIKRMEVAYLEQNKREYELTKHISLALLDPVALVRLKQTGECYVTLPEVLFDLDCPGHYMRRIKSVGLTIPCVTGPYANTNCTLTLLKSSIRMNAALVNDVEYARLPDDDPRFKDSLGVTQSIVTSSAQNDSGLFETNLHDERYLPFEGAGVISEWRLELSGKWKDADGTQFEFPQFDFDTISDVILHLRYTAREGGEPLKQAAVRAIGQTLSDASNRLAHGDGTRGLTQLFSLRHDFPSEWYRFVNSANTHGNHEQAFSLAKERFPSFFQGHSITITGVDLFGVPKQGASTNEAPVLALTLRTPAGNQVELEDGEEIGRLLHKVSKGKMNVVVESISDKSQKKADWSFIVAAGDVPQCLDRLADIFVLCRYEVAISKNGTGGIS